MSFMDEVKKNTKKEVQNQLSEEKQRQEAIFYANKIIEAVKRVCLKNIEKKTFAKQVIGNGFWNAKKLEFYYMGSLTVRLYLIEPKEELKQDVCVGTFDEGCLDKGKMYVNKDFLRLILKELYNLSQSEDFPKASLSCTTGNIMEVSKQEWYPIKFESNCAEAVISKYKEFLVKAKRKIKKKDELTPNELGRMIRSGSQFFEFTFGISVPCDGNGTVLIK